MFVTLTRSLLDKIFGAPRVLNLGEASGKTDAKSLKKAFDMLLVEAFDASTFQVHYTALQQSASFAEVYVQSRALQHFDLSSLREREEQLAFWLNLYNAMTIHGIVALGIKDSVREVPRYGFFHQISYQIGAECFSLDDIEHGILRANRRHPLKPIPQFASKDARNRHTLLPLDPRIHFALNCASRSCPPIAFYDAAQLEAQLSLATASFLGSGGCSLTDDGLLLSPILQWYANDFGGREGVLAFVAKYHPEEAVQKRCMQSPKLSYTDYDWRLNKTTT